MWNDEDNNPYGSFDRRDSNISDINDSSAAATSENVEESSTSASPGQPDAKPSGQAADYSDTEYDEETGERRRAPRKAGYDSRIEQILHEHPDLPIVINEAGKNVESGGNYITYTIRTGDIEVRRRYSEFASLRQTLVNLHPTLIVPPIPEKHTMADYAAKPTKARDDQGIIDLRRRMLAVFLNRCRKMKEIREDGVWWRFLDPHASWNEVLNSPPVSSIPKNNLKAPPLDPSKPTAAHSYLPIPSVTAKLKGAGAGAASTTPTTATPVTKPSVAAHTIPGTQLYGRFPPSSQQLSEEDFDPYFVNFEASSRELEGLLQGSMEKANRRLLLHLSALSEDLAELGARCNAFSLSEDSPLLAAAIERIGQAADSTFLETRNLSNALSETYAEPMRESAQFAGVVRSVLRYRVLKRVQGEMTKDELERKKALLESLERSEQEAQRIDQYLSRSGMSPAPPKRSASTVAKGSKQGTASSPRLEDDTASIDSDFPPTYGETTPASSPNPNQPQPKPRRQPAQSQPQPQPPSQPQSPPQQPSQQPQPHQQPQQRQSDDGSGSPTRHHRKSASATFVTSKIFGRLNHAIHGIVDIDPEKTRRDHIGKTKESLVQLEEALIVSEKDVRDASAGVLGDLKRFQVEKEEDLKRYMIAFARCHIDWAKRNVASWEEAKAEVERIEI